MSRGARIYQMGAVLAVAALTVAACGSSNNAKTTGPSPSSSGSNGGSLSGTIKIGLVNPLSGSLAAVGASENGAVKAAVAYLNKNGGIDGKQIDLIVRDDQGSVTDGVSATNSLISSGVQVLMGGGVAAVASAMSPIAQAKGIPFFSLGDGVYNDSTASSYTFQVPINISQEGVAIAKEINTAGYKHVAIVHTNEPYGQGIAAAVAANGVKPVNVQQISFDGTDFTAAATQLKSAKPDAIVLAVAGVPAAIMLKNLQEAGYTGPIVGAQALFTLPVSVILQLAGPNSLSNASGDAFATLVASSLPSSDPRTTMINEYQAGFLATNGKADALSGFGAMGWDAVMLLNQAVKGGGSTSGSSIRDSMEKISGFTGALGTYSFSATNHQGGTATGTVVVHLSGTKWVPATS